MGVNADLSDEVMERIERHAARRAKLDQARAAVLARPLPGNDNLLTASDVRDLERAQRHSLNGRNAFKASRSKGGKAAHGRDAAAHFAKAGKLRKDVADRVAFRAQPNVDLIVAEATELEELRHGAVTAETVEDPETGRRRKRARRRTEDGLSSLLGGAQTLKLLGERRCAELREPPTRLAEVARIESRRLLVCGLLYRGMVQDSFSELQSQMADMDDFGVAGVFNSNQANAIRVAQVYAGKMRREIEAAVLLGQPGPVGLALFRSIAGEGRSLRATAGQGGNARCRQRELLIAALYIAASTMRMS